MGTHKKYLYFGWRQEIQVKVHILVFVKLTIWRVAPVKLLY